MPNQKTPPESVASGIGIGQPLNVGSEVQIPIKTLVLHGLIGGSTGTGKSRLIQLLSENLNDLGIPVLLADLKGDMTGFIKPNSSTNSLERASKLGLKFNPKSFSPNFFSISDRFIPFRLSLDSIDPILIARVLKLNSTQESNLKMTFLYAKQKEMVIRDLIDLQTILTALSKNPNSVPGASKQSIDVILRQVGISIGDGLNELFGEPSIQVSDLLRNNIHCLNLSDWRKRIDLPSILMGFVLYRLFQELEEIGSSDRPKIVLFIDEAHYLFQESNPSLTNLFVTILKQIRSKGVAVFFSTQNPEDIPEKILEQLGCKAQFALRAFTKDELDDISGVADSFPPTTGRNLAREIQELEIGQAIVSPLSESGKPMKPIKTNIYPPRSYMNVISDDEIISSLDQSLVEKYSPIELDRYDLSQPFEGLKIVRRDSWTSATTESTKYSRKQSRMVSRQWSKLKMIGVFFFILCLLFIIILLLILYLTKGQPFA